MRSAEPDDHETRLPMPGGEPSRAAVGRRLVVLCLLVTIAPLTAGCSGGAKAGKKPRPATAKQDDTSAEGDVDPDTALVVDDGRVEVCSPAGWTRAPQSKGYLVKYVPGRKKTYPSIVVLAADAPEGLAEVDAESHADFVAAVAEGLDAVYTQNGKSTLVKKPAAIRLGPHFGVTWSAPATVRAEGVAETIDRVSYAVLLNGRKYDVEVRAPKGKLDAEGRAAAKAVAAALAAPEVPAPAAEPTAPTEPASDAAAPQPTE